MAGKTTSKTLLLTGYGGYDKMAVVQQPRPSAGKGEVVVNFKANGLNFSELMCRQGVYDRTPKLPALLGMEGAGLVVEIGENVNNVKVGDRVFCMSDWGMWTEYRTLPDYYCHPMPDDLTYVEAAAIPVNYVTAYHMLFDFGNLRQGQSVLIHMAAGGVGIAATQLCRTVPDVTIFGTASASKHEVLKANGVDHPIDYRTEDYVKEIRKISPDGVDLVLDPLSGVDATRGFGLLKPLGKIMHFGAANLVMGPNEKAKSFKPPKSINCMDLMTENKAMCGYHLGFIASKHDLLKRTLADLTKLYYAGKIKPKIDSVWSYEDIGKAMGRMHDRLNVGKVIICPQPLDEE